MRRALAVGIIFAVLAAATWVFFKDPKFLNDAGIIDIKVKTKRILIRGTLPITVEIADTEVARDRGLSGLEGLKDNTGLLMVFDVDTNAGIWMKGMFFAIDIIWLDAGGTVITVARAVQPDTYPSVFYPDKPARYVLEVPAGFADINNIEPGVRIDL